mgnify:CR=1 FL=1
MNETAYRPQKHAKDVQDLAEQVREFKRGQAVMLATIERLAAMVAQLVRDDSAKAPADPALDALIAAAFDCLSTSTWTLQDLLVAAGKSNDAGDRLLAVVSAIGKGNARSVGKFLATNVQLAHVTPGGLELRRCGTDRNSVAWTIAHTG